MIENKFKKDDLSAINGKQSKNKILNKSVYLLLLPKQTP